MARSTAISGVSSVGSAAPGGLVRTVRAKLLVDGDHYDDLVAARIGRAAVSVWIATANLKTMLVEAPVGTRARARGRYVSFFETLAELTRKGVEVRVLHAGSPSRPLAQELRRLESASRNVALRRCPRVHLKLIAIDGRWLYLGSANLTGAGLGAKATGRRNFEMGIVTDDEGMLDAAQERFDRIWRGAECASCKLRRECDAPLDQLSLAKTASGRAGKHAASTAAGPPAARAKALTSRGGSRPARRSPSAPA